MMGDEISPNTKNYHHYETVYHVYLCPIYEKKFSFIKKTFKEINEALDFFNEQYKTGQFWLAEIQQVAGSHKSIINRNFLTLNK